MGQQNVLIPYETIAAYNASQGIALYNGDSGQESDVNFTVLWDPDTGFTGQDWYFNEPHSPAFGKDKTYIKNEIENNKNLDDLFKNWHINVSAANRLAWINAHMGCVS